MAKLSVAHLFNHDLGVRYHLMIAQGLMAHPDITPYFSTPIVSLGETVADKEINIEQRMFEADYIFRPNDGHFGIEEMDRFMDRHGLWKKTVYYDKQDSPHICDERLQSCAAYIKRSWSRGPMRRPRPQPSLPVLPMDYGLLNEYYFAPEPGSRDINITCAFKNDPGIGRRRYGIMSALKKVEHLLGETVIGSPTAYARMGRRAIYDPSDDNPFLDYLKILKRSRIVFTASPENHGGDSRTWEAFSSGALVFRDDSGIPSAFPLQHGKHCIVYDSASESSISEAIEQAAYYLEHEDERQEIARNGYQYALKHHMPVARMNAILHWLRSPDKKLEDHVVL